MPSAVRRAVIDADPTGEFIGEDRPADDELPEIGVVTTRAAFHVTLKLFTRFARRRDDRAGRCGTAVDRALRPFQHFDLAHIGEFAVERTRVRVQDAVDDEREVRFTIAGAVDAADRNLRVADLGRVRQIHPGREIQKIPGAFNAGALNVGFRECGDRSRHILQAFRALARRDNDFLECLRGCRERRAGNQRRSEAQ